MKFNLIAKSAAFSVFAITALAMQNPVMALGNQKTSVEPSLNSKVLNDHQGAIGLPILLAQNDYYRSPGGDFRVLMLGDVVKNEITQNKDGELTSFSRKTGTAYAVIGKDFPNAGNVDFLSTQDRYRILNESFRSSSKVLGNKILKVRNISIKEYSGIDALVQSPDGSVTAFRQYLVRNRIYVLVARSEGELNQEVDDFFDSFEVYPSKIIPR